MLQLMEQSSNLYAKLLESRVSLKLDSVICVSFCSGVIPTVVDLAALVYKFPKLSRSGLQEC